MRLMIGLIALIGLAGGVFAALLAPTDTDHAKATPRAMLMVLSDPAGTGPLDGLRFDTKMGLQGKPAELIDYVQFDQGLFMSRECTDRCNYPPSAYLTRAVDDGHEFIVEAYCPTKNTTMVWRGRITGQTVAGTVTWTSTRWYWRVTQVLEFNGTLSDRLADNLAPT